MPEQMSKRRILLEKFQMSIHERKFREDYLKMCKGKYRSTLIAERMTQPKGDKYTQSDMESLEDASIWEVEEVKQAYVKYVRSDAKYRTAKINYESEFPHTERR